MKNSIVRTWATLALLMPVVATAKPNCSSIEDAARRLACYDNLHPPRATVAVASPVRAAPVTNAPLLGEPWTGFYAGLIAGYGGGRPHFLSSIQAMGAGVGGGITDGHDRINGFVGGAFAGYDHQLARVVLGLSAEITPAFISSNSSYNSITGSPGFVSTTTGNGGSRIKSIARLSGRLGYAFGDFMPYVSAGVALTSASADISGVITQPSFPPVYSTGANRNTRIGPSVGAGFEMMVMPNVSVRTEYVYTSATLPAFMQYQIGVGTAFSGPLLAAISTTQRNSLGLHILRVGAAYRFGT